MINLMFKIKEIERMKTLADLIQLSKPIDEIFEDLSTFPWDGTENLVTLNSKDMHHVLTCAIV